MLDRLIETSERYDEHKLDFGPSPVREHMFNVGTGELVVTTNGSLFGGREIIALDPTLWAFGQICTKLGPAAFPDSSRSLPRDYLLACPPAMRAEQLNYWISNMPENREWLVRAYRDDARAVLSDRYVSIGVTETLSWVKEALDSRGASAVEIHNPVVTPDVLHLRVLFTVLDMDGDEYKIGGYFTTGEIGNRRLGAYPLVQRTACTNSIAIPHDSWSWDSRHVGQPAVLKHLFTGAIFQVLEGSAEALEQLLDARTQQLPDFTDHIDKLVKDRGWSEKVKKNILVGSEGYESLFGMVQGVSFAANKLEDEDDKADMQLVAGELLFARRGR